MDMGVMMELSDADIDIRIKCAVQYTDITVLAMCMVSFFLSLQDDLAAQGKYRQQTKRTLNMASQLAINICTEIETEMRSVNKGYTRSYAELYDRMMELIQDSVLLTGEERWMSLINTSLALITSKTAYLHQHKHTFVEMQCVERYNRIVLYLRDIKIPSHDLEPILRPLLKKLVTAEELKETKDRYLRAVKQATEILKGKRQA